MSKYTKDKQSIKRKRGRPMKADSTRRQKVRLKYKKGYKRVIKLHSNSNMYKKSSSSNEKGNSKFSKKKKKHTNKKYSNKEKENKSEGATTKKKKLRLKFIRGTSSLEDSKRNSQSNEEKKTRPYKKTGKYKKENLIKVKKGETKLKLTRLAIHSKLKPKKKVSSKSKLTQENSKKCSFKNKNKKKINHKEKNNINEIINLKNNNDKSKLKIVYGKEGFERELLNKITQIRPSCKVNCTNCKKELSFSMRIITKSLKDFCFDCLIGLQVKEDYFIVDNLNFPIFNSEWTLKEEINLLNCIEKFGLDNWGEISAFIRSKPRVTCESHYYTYYLKGISNVLPIDKEVIINKSDLSNLNQERNKENQKREEELRKVLCKKQGVIPEFNQNKENKNNRSRSLVKNRNKKEGAAASPEEIVGFWPKRNEFDTEYFNEAEIEVAELEFLDDDTDEDRDMKLKVLEIYNLRLAEREKRKK